MVYLPSLTSSAAFARGDQVVIDNWRRSGPPNPEMQGWEGLFRWRENCHALLVVPCRFDGKQRSKSWKPRWKSNSNFMFAAGLSQVTHVFIFLAFLQKEVNVYLSSRCLLSTRQSLTLTTTPLALTLPLIFWLLSADSRDTSSASTANSDDVYANCQLFSQLLLLKLIEIG